MKIACVVSKFPVALQLHEKLKKLNIFVPLNEADVIICLGGDGFMLHSIHSLLNLNKPIYGINCGSLGFLLNKIEPLLENNLQQVLQDTIALDIYPLEANIVTSNGDNFTSFAFNEVSLLRKSSTASHLQIVLDDSVKMAKLVADGILIATPVGSTAYNLACGGYPLAICSNMLALTPINPFNPLNWRGAIINNSHTIDIVNLDIENRPINLCCDFKDFMNVKKVTIKSCDYIKIRLLFKRDDNLEDKIIKAQFAQQ